MSSRFLNVLKQAKLTFDRNNYTSFTNNFSLLKQLIDQITVNDLLIDQYLFSKHAFNQPGKAPCTYLNIYESENYTVSVFILADSYTMPLHDHPMMYGILRTIVGELKINTYTKIPSPQTHNTCITDNAVTTTTANTDTNTNSNKRLPQYITTKLNPTKQLSEFTESAIVTPNESNYHEITAIKGPAAFFDILSPPYGTAIPVYGRRTCSFYDKFIITEVADYGEGCGEADNMNDTNINNDGTNSKNNIIGLVKIPAPSHYFCDNIDYILPFDFHI